MTPNEKPILFSGAMVKAILDGRKTQTRRVIKLPLHCRSTGCELTPGELSDRELHSADTLCPYGNDRLWVRETFQLWDHSIDSLEVAYKEGWPEASKIVETRDKPKGLHARKIDKTKPWRPSIYMPRWASRITLEITEIRVERVQEISGPDAQAEGWPRAQELYPNVNTNSKAQDWFMRLWDSINGKKHPWASNPYVWVLTFKRV